MAYLESHVATKTFTQVNRVVKCLVAPTGNAVNPSGVMPGWGGQLINLVNSSAGPAFSNDYMTTHDLMLWNPTGDGRANLSQLKTNGVMADRTLANTLGNVLWNFGAGPVASGYTCSGDIHSPIHDPDVRGLYPNSPCRTTDARLVVDINMGGGSATIRAAPFTKDMCNMTAGSIRDHLLADRHVVSVIDIGGGGTRDKRIVFPKWVQSRKAVGEFTVAKLNMPATTQPDDAETPSSGMAALYTDEFCYGGWVFVFENIAPASYGSVPFIRMASAVEIQVQLSLQDNHLRDGGPARSFEKHLRDHEKLAGNAAAPRTTEVKGSPTEEAVKKSTPNPPRTKPKGGTVAAATRTVPQVYQGPPGHARRGPNMRGKLPPQQQAQKSKSAKQNRAATAAQVNRLTQQVIAHKGKAKSLTAWQQLGALFGVSQDPPLIALHDGSL